MTWPVKRQDITWSNTMAKALGGTLSRRTNHMRRDDWEALSKFADGMARFGAPPREMVAGDIGWPCAMERDFGGSP